MWHGVVPKHSKSCRIKVFVLYLLFCSLGFNQISFWWVHTDWNPSFKKPGWFVSTNQIPSHCNHLCWTVSLRRRKKPNNWEVIMHILAQHSTVISVSTYRNLTLILEIPPLAFPGYWQCITVVIFTNKPHQKNQIHSQFITLLRCFACIVTILTTGSLGQFFDGSL